MPSNPSNDSTNSKWINGSEALVLKRSVNRLPWLDGLSSSHNLPGSFDTELTTMTDLRDHRRLSLGKPDIQTAVSPRRVNTEDLPDVPGSFARRGGTYTPSAYSLTQKTDLGNDSQSSLRTRKDAASYEKLVDKPYSRPDHSGAPEVPVRSSSLHANHSNKALTADPSLDLLHTGNKRNLDGNLSSDASAPIAPETQRNSRPVPLARKTMKPHQNAPMKDAVSNLKGLMDEAIRNAAEAEKQNRPDDMTAIFREASLALRDASQVGGKMKGPLGLSDIELSPTSDESDSSSDSMSGSSAVDLSRRKQTSEETMPTEYSNSVPSTSPHASSLSNGSPNLKLGRLEVPHKIEPSSEGEVSPGTIIEKPLRGQLGLPVGLQRLNQPPSADSIVIDFAYMQKQPRLLSTGVPVRRKDHRKRTPRSRGSDRYQEDVDGRPEDIDETLSRGKGVREEPIPKLINLPPVPIKDPAAAAGGGLPTRRKSRYHAGSRSRGDKYQRSGPASRTETPVPETVLVPVAITPAPEPEATLYKTPTGYRNSSKSFKYKRRPIAREWKPLRKRITAVIACLNTALIGLVAGIYAGEVPKIQYQLADTKHRIILGNVFFYIGLAITTLFAWPLPLLHGRKPYILIALGLTLPLQFPQAISVSQYRSPDRRWYVALLLPRAASGLVLGFANVNFLATLFDLFGASLQSHRPHQEIVTDNDTRREGGGIGLWLGLWAWCYVGSLAVGFLLGAAVTAELAPSWGFYFVVILLAIFLLMNVVAPETRRAPHRRSILHFFDAQDNLQRKIARGEVKLHFGQDGPKHWWEEVWAGVRLMTYMMSQVGFAVLALYLAWIYALVVLVTLLLGALLSTNYFWKPQYVGLGVFALAVGAVLAVPLTKANLFSRDRDEPARTDSMTFQPRVTWSSHLVRRCIFTFALPLAGLAFTLTSPGPPRMSWPAPTILSATVGFLSTLAVAECIGITMETYDTCDLQPGVNSRHRLQSMDDQIRRRRTNFSSFPRVIAGLYASQGLGFFLAAAATGVSGRITRALGAQAATGVVAGILLFLTILLSLVLWRFRTVQVIPNHAFGTKKGSKEWTTDDDDKFWKPVIVGNPSGKVRRMNLLETGKWSRWTEIRRLNKLVKPGTWETQFPGR